MERGLYSGEAVFASHPLLCWSASRSRFHSHCLWTPRSCAHWVPIREWALPIFATNSTASGHKSQSPGLGGLRTANSYAFAARRPRPALLRNGSYTSPLAGNRCNKTASFRATATTACFRDPQFRVLPAGLKPPRPQPKVAATSRLCSNRSAAPTLSRNASAVTVPTPFTAVNSSVSGYFKRATCYAVPGASASCTGISCRRASTAAGASTPLSVTMPATRSSGVVSK
jgi:hypothetical protein